MNNNNIAYFTYNKAKSINLGTMMKNVSHETVSATDFVRNFSIMVDKVRTSGKSLYITKGMQTIAELSPPPKAGFSIHNLVYFLQSLPRLNDDSKAFLSDLALIKNKTKLPRDPWG